MHAGKPLLDKLSYDLTYQVFLFLPEHAQKYFQEYFVKNTKVFFKRLWNDLQEESKSDYCTYNQNFIKNRSLAFFLNQLRKKIFELNFSQQLNYDEPKFLLNLLSEIIEKWDQYNLLPRIKTNLRILHAGLLIINKEAEQKHLDYIFSMSGINDFFYDVNIALAPIILSLGSQKEILNITKYEQLRRISFTDNTNIKSCGFNEDEGNFWFVIGKLYPKIINKYFNIFVKNERVIVENIVPLSGLIEAFPNLIQKVKKTHIILIINTLKRNLHNHYNERITAGEKFLTNVAKHKSELFDESIINNLIEDYFLVSFKELFKILQNHFPHLIHIEYFKVFNKNEITPQKYNKIIQKLEVVESLSNNYSELEQWFYQWINNFVDYCICVPREFLINIRPSVNETFLLLHDLLSKARGIIPAYIWKEGVQQLVNSLETAPIQINYYGARILQIKILETIVEWYAHSQDAFTKETIELLFRFIETRLNTPDIISSDKKFEISQIMGLLNKIVIHMPHLIEDFGEQYISDMLTARRRGIGYNLLIGANHLSHKFVPNHQIHLYLEQIREARDVSVLTAIYEARPDLFSENFIYEVISSLERFNRHISDTKYLYKLFGKVIEYTDKFIVEDVVHSIKLNRWSSLRILREIFEGNFNNAEKSDVCILGLQSLKIIKILMIRGIDFNEESYKNLLFKFLEFVEQDQHSYRNIWNKTLNLIFDDFGFEGNNKQNINIIIDYLEKGYITSSNPDFLHSKVESFLQKNIVFIELDDFKRLINLLDKFCWHDDLCLKIIFNTINKKREFLNDPEINIKITEYLQLKLERGWAKNICLHFEYDHPLLNHLHPRKNLLYLKNAYLESKEETNELIPVKKSFMTSLKNRFFKAQESKEEDNHQKSFVKNFKSAFKS